MLGAIAGDIAGSRFEGRPLRGAWQDFPLFSWRSHFTDDTVMTLAVAEALRQPGPDLRDALINSMHAYGSLWPHAGYGKRFGKWVREKQRESLNSFGNGSAMRVSAAGWAAASLEEAEQLAFVSAAVTHNHPEGIRGAQAVASAIYLARTGASKDDIRAWVAGRHNYNLARSLDDIRETYSFDVTCQGSVPEAIIAFLESNNFEDAVRKAIWLRGDADTQAAIAGSIAEAFFGGIPADIAEEALARLDERLHQSYETCWQWLCGRCNQPLAHGLGSV